MKRITLLLACVLTVNFGVKAQGKIHTSLADLFSAIETYPGLNAQLAHIEAAKLNYQITKRDFLPDIRLHAQNTYGTYEGISGGFFPIPGIVNFSGNGSEGNTAINSYVSATAQWKFIRFGKHRDRLKLAQLGTDKAQVQYDVKKIDVQYKLSTAYINWLYSLAMLSWAREETTRNQEVLKLSRSLVISGLASAADSLAAKTSLELTRSLQHKWQAQSTEYSKQIKELAGVRPQFIPEENALLSTSNQIQDKRDKTHPLLLMKEQEKKRLTALKQYISHSTLPDISLLAGGLLRGVGFTDQTDAWKDSYALPVNNYLLGIGLSWNIDAFFTAQLDKQRIQQLQTSNMQEREAIQLSLTAQEESLRFHIEEAFAQIQAANAAYDAALSSYELFKVRYEKGLIDLTALLQIQRSLQYAEKSRIKAYYDYWHYQVEYAFAKADFTTLITQFN